MNTAIVICITVSFVAAALIVACIVAAGSIRKYYELRNKSLDLSIRDNELRGKAMELKEKEMVLKKKREEQIASLQYSKELMDFVREIVGQVCVLKFKEFCDQHPQIDKITESNVKGLVSDISQSVRKFININNIAFSETIFTPDFYNHYVIEMIMTYIKDLVDKKISEVIG